MLQLNEFRSGNYIKDSVQNCLCLIIKIDGMNLKAIVQKLSNVTYKILGTEYERSASEIEEILITDAWLEHLGFIRVPQSNIMWTKRQSNGDFLHVTFHINYSSIKIGRISFEDREVSAVHHLQNAIFDKEDAISAEINKIK